MMQNSDNELRKLIEIFKKNNDDRSEAEKRMIEGYVFKQNKAYRRHKVKDKEILLYVIPKAMRKSIVVRFHDLMEHFSVESTVSQIKELYWFASMKRNVRRHISMCFECLLNKVTGGKQQGFLNPIAPGKRPFSIIHVHHLGPFVKTCRGNQELLVIIDNLSRFVRVTPVRSTSSQNVLKALQNFINEFDYTIG
nr:uncharacterized protein LOC122271411 [Parasteatoda tepidariorum]